MITTKTIQPPPSADGEANQTYIRETLDLFMPLLGEYWAKYGKNIYGSPLDFDVFTFIQCWLFAGLTLVFASDEKGRVTGFLIGNKFRPITHNARMFQIEKYYGQDAESEQAVLAHVNKNHNEWGINEIILPLMQGSQSYGFDGERNDVTYRWYK